MKKGPWIIGTILFLMGSVLGGCVFQGGVTVKNNFEGITFESSVVELVNASLDFHEDKNVITKVDVKYLFRNIAGRAVEVSVMVEFYDKNDSLLVTRGPKYINLPKDYVETVYSPANIISYSGEKVSEVDHVRIIAEEKLNP
jgi:hypothetical protein